jgi:spermidine synthase
VPLTYYVPEGPVGDVFAALGADRPPKRVGVVGLGTGSMAAYGEEGDFFSYYELDPGIVRVATDTTYFTFLADSRAEGRVILGDARVSLERAPGEAPYDVLFLDAFSSDAIPMHLLTLEAMQLYLSRLAPGGMLAFHISNRYLTLEPVMAAMARDLGLAARIATGPRDEHEALYRSRSTWVVFTRQRFELGMLQVLEGWRDPEAPAGFAPWTDDFSSIWTVMNW